ncbi:MAG TPA: helix-turn-helix domain-containing protein [Acidimicrobiia bacterium]|nr:helix-turn-helix domain-containing protein [Acidimicrobiia bacterium]
MDYSERVGERLRQIRVQRGMSLQDVHRATGGEFKAAVLGAYERGERSLSLPRLRRLASCYDVPMSQLLPEEDTYAPPAHASGGVAIDLSKVDSLSPEVGEVVDRFLKRIQVQRQDFNGKVLTIRAADVAMLALMLDVSDQDLASSLERERA